MIEEIKITDNIDIFSIIKTEKKKGISKAISRSTNRKRIAIFKNWTHKPKEDLIIELNPHSKGFNLSLSPTFFVSSFFDIPKTGINNKIKVITSLIKIQEEVLNKKKLNIFFLRFL